MQKGTIRTYVRLYPLMAGFKNKKTMRGRQLNSLYHVFGIIFILALIGYCWLIQIIEWRLRHSSYPNNSRLPITEKDKHLVTWHVYICLIFEKRPSVQLWRLMCSPKRNNSPQRRLMRQLCKRRPQPTLPLVWLTKVHIIPECDWSPDWMTGF